MTTRPGTPGTDAAAEFRVVEISREPIELYKILKFEGMSGSGGQARAAVASGQVLVNGVVETRKRKKIISGDTIEFNENKICVRRSASIPTDMPSTKINVQQAPKQQKAGRKAAPQYRNKKEPGKK